MKKKPYRERIQWRNQLVNMVSVIIGIYLAFALNDWEADRHKQIQKKELINSLREDLLKDKKELMDGLAEIDTLNYKINGIFRYINNDSGIADSANYFLSGILRQPTFYPVNFTYQSLMNSSDLGGFDISFRKDMTELYDGNYALIKEIDQIGMRNFQEHIISMIIERGSYFEDEFLKSKPFVALAGITKDFLTQRQVLYQRSITLIDRLLQRIENGEV